MTQERHNWLVDGSHTGNVYGSVRHPEGTRRQQYGRTRGNENGVRQRFLRWWATDHNVKDAPQNSAGNGHDRSIGRRERGGIGRIAARIGVKTRSRMKFCR